MEIAAAIQIMRGLIQLGISVEQYKKAVDNPDMTDEELAKHIANNTDELEKLLNKDH